jgi:hypothetical protein
MFASIRRSRGGAWGRRLALVAATALLPVSGCSFLLLDRPPDRVAPRERINCTTSYTLPTFDTLLSLAHVASIAIVQSSSGDSFGGSKGRELEAQLDVSSLIFEGASAIWGFYKVNQCTELMAQQVHYHLPKPGREPGIEPGMSPRAPNIEQTPPGQEPGIEPPKPGEEPDIEPSPSPRKPSIEPTPGREPGIEPLKPPPAPPAPRVRQQMDSE